MYRIAFAARCRTTDYTIPLGKAAITRPGTQLTVIAYGLDGPLRARGGRSRGGGGDQRRGRRPPDPPAARQARRSWVRSGRPASASIVYEDNRFGGYGAEVAAIVAEEAFDYLDGPVTRIAGPDVPGVPYNHVLEDWFMVEPGEDRRRDPHARGVLSSWPTPRHSTRSRLGSGL